MKKLLTFFLSILVLTGCYTSSISSSISLTILDIVTNIRLEGDSLKWDEVDGADYYTLSIGSSTFEFISQPTYSLIDKGIPYGVLHITLSAHQEDSYSIPSQSFVSLEYHPSIIGIPHNLIINDKTLSWTPINYATGYIVTINEETLMVDSASFDLSSLGSNEFYTLSVQTKYLDQTSEPSIELHYESQFDSLGIIQLIQTKHVAIETIEIVLDALEGTILRVLMIDDNPVEPTFNGKTIYLTYDEFQAMPYGINYLKVYTEEGLVELQLTLIDDRAPYLISTDQVNVPVGESITFEFELYDGQITQVSGNDITSNDYVIEDNQLTILGWYIDFIFTRDVAREVIILGYSITANDHLLVGYIFIRRPSAE